jgi:hypothetical protein
MGYYSQFPEAIPLLKVGRVRVTHPSATRHLEQAPMLPFDLHVLSLPLAFILSQDQTLHCIISCRNHTVKYVSVIFWLWIIF